ncbi:protein involved in plasmid replication-relaxation [Bacillus oleivorans]|uniref:Protein involved in plasmid replication-relaxation n=1 Tax=Bacillus oleivorans TaxID=1448271 RepID=A0A285D6M2_9BACI|nr:replication-relaxation family protein [Bacillus oleivorans]SNX75295.1 protein involved in plasmid replication-relaxation [Bacillus oleivorans]
MSTSQIQEIHRLGKRPNTLRILKEMEPYLHKKPFHERNGEHVYYLNSLGRDVIGSTKERKWSAEVIEHYLMRNDFYINLGMPSTFEIEREIVLELREGLSYREEVIRCDALYKREGVYYFLEVDRTQSMSENKKKIERYKKASEVINKKFKQAPVVVFYTASKLRKINIEKYLTKTGLKYEVYSKEDI